MQRGISSALLCRAFSTEVSDNACNKAPYLQMISQIWLRTSGHIQFHDPPTFGPLKVKSKDEDHIKIVSHVIHQLDPNLGLSLASTPEVKGLQRLEAMKLVLLHHFLESWTSTDDISHPR